jgi:hypothetical protein
MENASAQESANVVMVGLVDSAMNANAIQVANMDLATSHGSATALMDGVVYFAIRI